MGTMRYPSFALERNAFYRLAPRGKQHHPRTPIGKTSGICCSGKIPLPSGPACPGCFRRPLALRLRRNRGEGGQKSGGTREERACACPLGFLRK
jgi:hypothetical protein